MLRWKRITVAGRVTEFNRDVKGRLVVCLSRNDLRDKDIPHFFSELDDNSVRLKDFNFIVKSNLEDAFMREFGGGGKLVANVTVEEVLSDEDQDSTVESNLFIDSFVTIF